MEASVDSLVLSEDTVPKLTSEKNHLQRTVSRLTTQLDETEKRLEEECIARSKLEENQEVRIKEVEASWAAVLDEKSSNWEAKERSLEDKVDNQDRLLKEIKASYEVSQRLGHGNDADNDNTRSAAAAAELEIVTSDLERISLRLAEMESRNEQLRLDLAQAASQPKSEHGTLSLEDNPAFLRLQTENSALLRKLDTMRFDNDTERHTWENKLAQLERQRANAAAEKDQLRNKLDKWADYDDIRQELEVIKSIEFSTGEEDETSLREGAPSESSAADSDNIRTNGTAIKDNKETLEQLVLARNKKLSSELTVLRVSHQDLQQQLETLRQEMSKTNAELERSNSLTATLENDLLKVQKETAHALPSSAMSLAGTYTSRYPQSSRRGRASPTSSIISGFDPHTSSSPNTLEALRAGEPVGGGSGILPMIQAQRDRFKHKNSQLEEELAKTYNTVTSLRQEISSLQKDNLNLYEKTRYVSTYNRGQPNTTSSSSAYSNNPNPSSIQMSSDTSSGLSLSRYRSQYEANISPFAAFRGRESARAYKRMSLPERVIYSITRMVLATRTSRNLFAGYCLALHLMVFLMLYWSGTVEVEKHASNLGDVASAAVVGNSALGGKDMHPSDWQPEGFSQGG